MRLVAISDTHTAHNSLVIPECDILVCAGDVVNHDDDISVFTEWLEWFSSQNATLKLFVPGNHDQICWDEQEKCKDLCEKAYVQMIVNESIELLGYRFWCSPYTPKYGPYQFMLPRDQMHFVWDNCHESTDIVVTHGPPRGILDLTSKMEHAGCLSLREMLQRVQPFLFICGHIHEGAGIAELGNITCVNATNYQVRDGKIRQPTVIDIDRKKVKKISCKFGTNVV